MFNPSLTQANEAASKQLAQESLAASHTTKFIEKLLSKSTSAWKWPQYKTAIYTDNFFRNSPPEQQATKGAFGRAAERFCKSQLRGLLSAGFIEWKYYSVLAKSFHGIIGLSLYNPEQRFGFAAEGGLLLVVAGSLGPQKSQLVYMKLFPESSLSGLDSNTLKATHERVNLILSDDSSSASIRISDGDDFEITCTVQGEELSSPWHSKPIVGRNLNPLPSGHWVVHNHIPAGQSTGRLFASQYFIESLQNLKPLSVFDPNCYWAPHTGQAVHPENCQEGSTWEWQDAPAYFEHSFGLHPLPSQGWDFFFAPLKQGLGGATLQSYKNSVELKQLDLFWRDPKTGNKHSTSFKGHDLKITWGEKEYDRKLNAWIPTQRKINGINENFTIQLEHRIDTTLRFLRPQTHAVRCFFIGEQIGTASWKLCNKKGTTIQEVTNTLAGGEIAYARFPSLGKHTEPFPV